jgi:hypothetical protein
MAVTDPQLAAIDQLLGAGGADRATLAELRKIGGLTATSCDPADLADETPFRIYERCALYLLDGRDHCMKITDDPDTATGLVVVAKR